MYTMPIERGATLASVAIHGIEVVGCGVDPQTRCAHYHGATDVVALKFKCCGGWHPCIECHRAQADHDAVVWPVAERQERAVLCGVCGHQLTIAAYLACGFACPRCAAAFNPGCASHYHLYFEMPDG